MTTEEYNFWKTYILKEFPKNRSLLEYLESFKNTPFPIIFSISHFSQVCNLSSAVLPSIVNSPRAFYRQFTIKKRNGKDRSILAPYPVLKGIQRWILDEILSKIEVNSASTGFVRGRTIIDNVSPHLGAKCFLKIDLKNFFPTIELKRVYSVFRNCGYTKKVSYCLASICCVDGALPQGSPASPSLANIICKRLDARLHKLANKFLLKYTRYADDIAFSGEKISWKFFEYVDNVVKSESLVINSDKTRLIVGPGKKILTGISIQHDKAQLPRETKRKYRSEAFNILKLKKLDYMNNVFSNDPVAIERVIGKFTFWAFIEPENTYVTDTLVKLKDYSENLYQ